MKDRRSVSLTIGTRCLRDDWDFTNSSPLNKLKLLARRVTQDTDLQLKALKTPFDSTVASRGY